ncbi:MAG: CocE/NonD family hydrolase [bacterium]
MCAQTATWAQEEEKPEPGKSVLVMVPMRDGVKLATEVEIPPGPKKRMPVVLLRTPYGRSLGGALSLFRGFVGGGYILVSQDTRGRFDSEGENLPFMTGQEDGYDTVEWIASQPWSDGRVGMIGGSALGITGYQAAIAAPPHLDCVLAVVAPANLQSQAILWGGQMRKDLAIGWTVGTGYPVEALTLMTDHAFYDDFAKKYDLAFNAQNVRTPMMHIGGWYDIFNQGTIAAFLALQENGGEGARGLQRLIMGPWTHGGMIGRKQGELEFPSNSTMNPMLSSILNWNNKCVEGNLKEVELPVQFYMMGDVDKTDTRWNVWKKSATWPPPGGISETWNLTPDKSLTTSTPAESKSFTYTFDPSNPVKTMGGGNLTIGTHGSVDQRKIENRPDVLVFDSPVFEEPYGIAGPVYTELTVSTTGCDTDFTAKLTDVYPDGRSMLIADGIARTSFREYDQGHLVPAEKDQKMRICIYAGDTAHTFNKGHKMRLAVSSSNHPRFSVNTNTCGQDAFSHTLIEAEYEDAKTAKKKNWSPTHDSVPFEIVKNTVYTGGADTSTLILPWFDLEKE